METLSSDHKDYYSRGVLHPKCTNSYLKQILATFFTGKTQEKQQITSITNWTNLTQTPTELPQRIPSTKFKQCFYYNRTGLSSIVFTSVFSASGSRTEPGCARVHRVYRVRLISPFKSSTESAFQCSSYPPDVII